MQSQDEWGTESGGKKRKIRIPATAAWFIDKFAAFREGSETMLTTPSFARTSSTRNLAPPAEMTPVSAGWPPPCGWKTVASSTTATRPPSSCGHPELSLGRRFQPRVARLRRREGKKPGGRRERWRMSGGVPPYHRSRRAWWGPPASPVQPPAPFFSPWRRWWETWQRSIAAGGDEEVRRVEGVRSGQAAPSGSNRTRKTLGCLKILKKRTRPDKTIYRPAPHRDYVLFTDFDGLMARLGFEVPSFFAQLSVCL